MNRVREKEGREMRRKKWHLKKTEEWAGSSVLLACGRVTNGMRWFYSPTLFLEDSEDNDLNCKICDKIARGGVEGGRVGGGGEPSDG
ncbi:hypothetical protein HN911_13420 [Candidatus Bathyarchaeota archaeon]|jgi:hypothetical protein|nr:hypothetical protein [Candidatus Bathyarchaeota archaeon]